MPSMPSYSTQADEPTLLFEDSAFNSRREIAEQLCDAIARCDPPQVFGVHGDWGAGKTSFLHYVQLRLTGECPQNHEWEGWDKGGKDGWRQKLKAPLAVAVWFEAWRYQTDSAPVVALLHEMRAQLTWKKHFLQKLTNCLEMGGETAFRTALMAFSDLTGKISVQAGVGVKAGGELGFRGPRFEEAWTATQQANLAQTLPSNQLREHLDRILEDLLPTRTRSPKTPRVVVFIDDLDRCEPEAAFSLLEGIKIYLNLKSCVFVLGLNRREVERAIAKVLPATFKERANDTELLTRAHEYVEKLCSNAIRLPRLSRAEQKVLLQRWLRDSGQTHITTPLCNLLDRHDMLPANPRRIKAFANTVTRLLIQLHSPPAGFSNDTHARAIAIIASLYQFHPHAYEALERDPAVFYRTLQDFCDRRFNTPSAEEIDRVAYPVPLLRNFVRPFSVSTGKIIEESIKEGGKLSLAEDEKAATPEPMTASTPTSGGKSNFTSLFASSTAIDVLHSQTLIAESAIEERVLEYYLSH